MAAIEKLSLKQCRLRLAQQGYRRTEGGKGIEYWEPLDPWDTRKCYILRWDNEDDCGVYEGKRKPAGAKSVTLVPKCDK